MIILTTITVYTLARRMGQASQSPLSPSVSLLSPAHSFSYERNRIREDWMVYKGPGFLAVVWFGSSPTSSPVSKLSLFLSLPPRAHWRERVERGWARSRIIQPWESLVLYKLFNTLWTACRIWDRECLGLCCPLPTVHVEGPILFVTENLGQCQTARPFK